MVGWEADSLLGDARKWYSDYLILKNPRNHRFSKKDRQNHRIRHTFRMHIVSAQSHAYRGS